jgi:hypothetical protein
MGNRVQGVGGMQGVKNAIMKMFGLSPDQMLYVIIRSIKNINEDDMKSLASIIANICINDKEACKSMVRLSTLIQRVCINILSGDVSGREKEA